jgi:hypothetical protein
MYYGGMNDDFVGLEDLAAPPQHQHGRRGMMVRRAHPRGRARGFMRGLADFLGTLGAKALPLTVPVPGYAYKRYACKAGGGTRQNQLKAEAYCGQSGFMAHVTSCTPFQYYCDQTLPVRVRKGNRPAPPGLIGGGGIAPTPCPVGYVMNAAGQCQSSLGTGACPPGYTQDTTGAYGGQCYATEVSGQCPQGATSTIQSAMGPLCIAPITGGGTIQPYPYPSPYPSPYPTPVQTVYSLPAGAVPMTPGQACPAYYTQVIYNGQYYCIPGGIGGAVGSCPPGEMFDPSTNACVSAVGGQPYIYPSGYQPPAYYPPQGMPGGYSPYGGPLLTPIDEGGGAATMDMTAYAEAPSAGMPGIPYGYGGPMLTPISEGMDYTEGGPSDQTNLVPFNQAAGGMPSPVGATQQSQQCQQEAAAPPTADAYGPLTPIKIVCAPAQPVMAQGGGGPFPGVQNPDVIAQQEIATMTGLGRWIG